MSAVLHRRADEARRRLLLRAFDYRQRNLARGVWGRLAGLLADSEHAFLVDEADADALEAGGAVPSPVGGALAPPKRIFVLPAAVALALPSHRPTAVRLSAELLAARSLALVPFGPYAIRSFE